MSFQSCRVCDQNTLVITKGTLMGKYTVRYYECPHCHYVQTEQPYWLDEAYSRAINISDTGILQRNIHNAQNILVILWMLGKLNGTVLDYAGGYGLLVRLLRDSGVDAYWTDKYCQNLFACGFELNNEKKNIDLLMAFEVFEHLVEPDYELAKMLELSSSVLFSTLLIPTPTPKLDGWWYYGMEHGQHIGFFRLKTLEYLATKNNKYLLTDGHSLHLFIDQKINSILFKIITRYNYFFKFLVKPKLVSKTFIDHEYCSKLDKKN